MICALKNNFDSDEKRQTFVQHNKPYQFSELKEGENVIYIET